MLAHCRLTNIPAEYSNYDLFANLVLKTRNKPYKTTLACIRKMNRKSKIFISLLLIISGWLMAGIGFTIKIGHPINTVLFLFGLLASVIGFIWLIILIKSKVDTKS